MTQDRLSQVAEKYDKKMVWAGNIDQCRDLLKEALKEIDILYQDDDGELRPEIVERLKKASKLPKEQLLTAEQMRKKLNQPVNEEQILLNDEELGYPCDKCYRRNDLNKDCQNPTCTKYHFYTYGLSKAKAQLAKAEPIIQAVERVKTLKEAKDILDFARGAINDAISLEDGLDGLAGEAVIKMITEFLGDEYKPSATRY